MITTVRLTVDGQTLEVPAGISIAAALLGAGPRAFRLSVTGEPRAPLCGMGVCHECRVTVDGIAHQRSCMVTVADGMRIVTHPATDTGTGTV